MIALQITYTGTQEVPLGDILDHNGIEEADVEYITIKWHTLRIVLKNGETLQYPLHDGYEIDTQYPALSTLLRDEAMVAEFDYREAVVLQEEQADD